jgi:hypothetical protein
MSPMASDDCPFHEYLRIEAIGASIVSRVTLFGYKAREPLGQGGCNRPKGVRRAVVMEPAGGTVAYFAYDRPWSEDQVVREVSGFRPGLECTEPKRRKPRAAGPRPVAPSVVPDRSDLRRHGDLRRRRTFSSHGWCHSSDPPRPRQAARPPGCVAGPPVALHDHIDEARAAFVRCFALFGELPDYKWILAVGGRYTAAEAATVGSEFSVATQIRAVIDAAATDLRVGIFPVGDDHPVRYAAPSVFLPPWPVDPSAGRLGWTAS